jgi:hypothetical protein
MAMYYEPKNLGPVEPQVCDRCRARMGVSWVDYMVPPGAEPESPRPSREWLCDACRAIVQRGAAQN